jgi:hypothetical protein
MNDNIIIFDPAVSFNTILAEGTRMARFRCTSCGGTGELIEPSWSIPGRAERHAWPSGRPMRCQSCNGRGYYYIHTGTEDNDDDDLRLF